MTTTPPETNVPNVAELSAEIDRARIAAEAELAWTALPGESSNPFAGAGDKLRELEAERDQAILRSKGEELRKAKSDLDTLDAEIARVSTEHRELNDTIQELRSDPVIVRWLAAPERAASFGLKGAWNVVGAFLASDAPWSNYPVQVSDVYTVNLPETLRFTEQDRETIHEWVAPNTRMAQLTSEFYQLNGRREHLLKLHPALRALP